MAEISNEVDSKLKLSNPEEDEVEEDDDDQNQDVNAEGGAGAAAKKKKRRKKKKAAGGGAGASAANGKGVGSKVSEGCPAILLPPSPLMMILFPLHLISLPSQEESQASQTATSAMDKLSRLPFQWLIYSKQVAFLLVR